MATYTIWVTTGQGLAASTCSAISITLVGAHGETPKHRLDHEGKDFAPGAVDEYQVPSAQCLGPIVLIRLHKEPYSFFPSDSWLCNCVQVMSPEGDTYRFPCYQWIEGYCTVELREGAAKTAAEDAQHPLLLQHRQEELKARQEAYRWKEYAPRWPRCLDVASVDELDSNNKYSLTKTTVFMLRTIKAELELKLKGFFLCTGSWEKLEDIRKIFWCNKNPTSEYVSEHWQEDSFFGYQFLNGVNPVVIWKCTVLPENFPVTEEMVASSLGDGTTLWDELKKGNIFLTDYKILEGIPTIQLNGEQQYLAAPLCLLHLTPGGQVVPLAIQLSQHPGPDSPIFLPSDPEWDWTLAKIWVRLANFHVHEVNTHLLEAHFLCEVYCMATLRQLPMCHPVYKLLIPHTRYTLHINTLVRTNLIQPGGLFDKASSTGRDGMLKLLAKGVENVSYEELCLPDDLEARGVSSLPNYYYRDDGMRIWTAVESFVSGIIGLYYQSDVTVEKDSELQAWVAEIFTEGFMGRKSSGVPSTLQTRAELIKFLTMIVYCSSARHAAVNSGQYDFAAWMPNSPATLRAPPPTTKGTATLRSILDTLPAVNATCALLSLLAVVSYEPGDLRPLGYYPEEHFTEEEPKRLIAAFQARLAEISKEIQQRNKSLPISYPYLDPAEVQNSVSI
ncbi:hydroperoxide isomerase ALOXE3-like [Malaclemys terrapin pileata]|uniref:hydroperoxide isomerase ALOXE3-like n=1 Tax=Malaclemys terrapin pileata TaxID=2991368 RepID=UPI0023A8F85F|nr:hydroperoxide isomerase ALOXE3-like [Malaclemys terrapin pileata]